MSTEDTVVVNIDDTQLAALELRLSNLGTEAQQTVGSRRLDLKLPGLNREMRLILGQIPGMREMMRLYFNIKRVERGFAYYKLGELAPAILTVGSLVVLLLAKMDQLERRQRQYEEWLRREKGYTKAEMEQYLIKKEKTYYYHRPGMAGVVS